MNTYAPQNESKQDLTVWALVALIVVMVCALAGWMIASSGVMDRDDLARSASYASQDGQARGHVVGYRQGAAQGRRIATMRSRAQINSARRQAAREGYSQGYQEGRSRAGDPDAFLTGSSFAGVAGTYPSLGYEDILAAGLFGDDAPGFADSAYDAYGFGAGTSTPYLGTPAPLTTSYGDLY